MFEPGDRVRVTDGIHEERVVIVSDQCEEPEHRGRDCYILATSFGPSQVGFHVRGSNLAHDKDWPPPLEHK